MKSINGKDLKNKNLFHLSFNGTLEGTWLPKLPDGDFDDDVSSQELLAETMFKRISVSPSIEQCFMAIYANVKLVMNLAPEKEGVEFNIYKPDIKDNTKIITPATFTKEKAIHDAHVTQEHGIITPVFMKHVGTVSILKPGPKDKLDYYAFNIKGKNEKPYGWLPSPVKVRNLNIKEN